MCSPVVLFGEKGPEAEADVGTPLHQGGALAMPRLVRRGRRIVHVAPGRGREGVRTLQRAEVVLDALIGHPAGGAVNGDCHPADWIDRQLLRGSRALGNSGVQQHGLSDVLELMAPSRLEVDLLELAGRPPRDIGNQHPAARRHSGDAGGRVDGRPEPVAGTLCGGARMHADPDAREPVPDADLAHDPEAQCDRVGGRAGADHHRVADRLDLLRVVIR